MTTERTVPLGDLTDRQLRDLLGVPVTVKVYEGADDKKPVALNGTLASVARTEEFVLIAFEHQTSGSQPLDVALPITFTFEEYED